MPHGPRHYFCDNERAALHVPHVPGLNWAELPDGRLYSRERKGEFVYCDACLVDPTSPVELEAPPGKPT